jgi:hypothetical protein
VLHAEGFPASPRIKLLSCRLNEFSAQALGATINSFAAR